MILNYTQDSAYYTQRNNKKYPHEAVCQQVML